MSKSISKLNTLLFSVLALCAFAANSILARLALGSGDIDAASFTVVRLLSAILMLTILIKVRNKGNLTPNIKPKSSWFAALMLFVYAGSFSFAYLSLDTGIGALVLFAAVQITMVISNYFKGNRLQLVEFLGLIIAFSGFLYLIFPSLSKPSLQGFILMTVSGIAWAFYTLKGQGASDPLSATNINFARTLPFIVILFIFSFLSGLLNYTWPGLLLAIMSGSLASALGYYCWYLALAKLSITVASVIQLSVPIIAALGGVIFMAEPISFDFIIACSLVSTGILLVVLANYRKTKIAC